MLIEYVIGIGVVWLKFLFLVIIFGLIFWVIVVIGVVVIVVGFIVFNVLVLMVDFLVEVVFKVWR